MIKKIDDSLSFVDGEKPRPKVAQCDHYDDGIVKRVNVRKLVNSRVLHVSTARTFQNGFCVLSLR